MCLNEGPEPCSPRTTLSTVQKSRDTPLTLRLCYSGVSRGILSSKTGRNQAEGRGSPSLYQPREHAFRLIGPVLQELEAQISSGGWIEEDDPE